MSASPSRELVILTGAAGGIGTATARLLAGQGFALVLVGRRLAPLQAQAAALPGGPHSACAADLTVAAGRDRLLAHCRERLQREGAGLVGLVNNAGVAGFALLEDLDDKHLRQLLETNVLAPIALCRDVLPLLAGQPRASLINIGSTFGSIGFAGFSGYCAGKFALRGFTQALRRELAEGPVQVHYIAPRAVATGLNSPAVDRLNTELGNAVDAPEVVAAAVLAALRDRRGRDRFLGWPEKLFVRLNALLPGLVDGALRRQLDAIRRAARDEARSETPLSEANGAGGAPSTGAHHETL